jgi:transposase
VRNAYPTDVSDDEWALVAPYLTLLAEDALQRPYPLREVFNALRWIVRAGAPWRLLPTNFPPWPTVYQQTRRWLEAGCFEALVHGLRLLLRLAQGRDGQTSAAILDARVLQSSPESGGARRLRRAQAAQGVQSACGGGYVGPALGPDRHPRQRRRADPKWRRRARRSCW